MNTRDLEYIIAVDKFKHFGKASNSVNVSQPTLSNQIKKFEERFGLTIFERSNKSVMTTAAGKAIITEAEKVMSALSGLESTAQTNSNPFAGNVTVGFIPTIAPYLIPLMLKHVSDKLPDLKRTYKEDVTDNLLASLKRGDIDFAMLATMHDDTALASIPVYTEPFWLVTPLDHPLAEKDHIERSDIPVEELLLLGEGHCFASQALSFCGMTTEDNTNLSATSLETIIYLVAAGQGLTFMPALAITGTWGNDLGVVPRKIIDEGAARTVYLTYRRQSSRLPLLNKIAGMIRQLMPSTVTVLEAE